MIYTIKSLLSKHGVYLDNITVDGENHLIDFITSSDSYICEDINNKIIANLDPNLPLVSKILAKGVFETIDKITGKTISIQFYKSAPFEIKNPTEFD